MVFNYFEPVPISVKTLEQFSLCVYIFIIYVRHYIYYTTQNKKFKWPWYIILSTFFLHELFLVLFKGSPLLCTKFHSPHIFKTSPQPLLPSPCVTSFSRLLGYFHRLLVFFLKKSLLWPHFSQQLPHFSALQSVQSLFSSRPPLNHTTPDARALSKVHSDFRDAQSSSHLIAFILGALSSAWCCWSYPLPRHRLHLASGVSISGFPPASWAVPSQLLISLISKYSRPWGTSVHLLFLSVILSCLLVLNTIYVNDV